MTELLSSMLELLEEQKQVHETLLDLSHEKRQMIIKNNIERLGEIVEEELTGLSKLNSLEKKRAAILAKLAPKLDMPEDAITISALMECSEGEMRKCFFVLQKEMGGLLREQSEMNQLNRELLETQIEYTDVMLNAVVGPADPLNNFYGGDGKSSDDDRRHTTGLFDTQI